MPPPPPPSASEPLPAGSSSEALTPSGVVLPVAAVAEAAVAEAAVAEEPERQQAEAEAAVAQAMTAAGWGDEARPSATWAAATVVASFTAEGPSELSVAQGAPSRIVGMVCACVRLQVG